MTTTERSDLAKAIDAARPAAPPPMTATSKVFCADSADEARGRDSADREPGDGDDCGPTEADGCELSDAVGMVMVLLCADG